MIIIQIISLQIAPQSQNFIQSSSSASTPSSNLYFLRGNDKRLLNQYQQIEIASFIDQHKLKSSTYVYNSQELKRKYRKWVETFPWIKPHYAIKSNSCLPILKDLIQQDSNFDCASKKQIQTLLSLGVDPTKIVYSNSIKEEQDLEWVSKNNIQITTADTIEELEKIKQYAPNIKILWRIAIKQEAGDNLSTNFSGKFGDDIQSDEKIQERMKQIQKMNISLKGIHFHCGSGMQGSSAFQKAIKNARRCLQIGRIYGHQMNLLDIGGGFPAGEIPQKTINYLKVTQNDPLGYEVIAEPGRHFCASSFYVLTKVLGKRIKSNKTCYHINESLYHTFNCVLMDDVSIESENQFYSKVDSKSLKIKEINQKAESVIFGMTCDGVDIIAKNAHVPIEMKVGDWLCVAGMGAYTYGSRTQFNGMKSLEKIINWPARIQNSLQ